MAEEARAREMDRQEDRDREQQERDALMRRLMAEQDALARQTEMKNAHADRSYQLEQQRLRTELDAQEDERLAHTRRLELRNQALENQVAQIMK